jgi:hypothetical protein
MDSSIQLPYGYRIGFDPIIGLVPGLGDVITSAISGYLIYEAARLGIPKRVLLRMVGNVLLDAAVGEVPLLGDVFDATWKANIRNLRLVERWYSPTAPERPAGRILAVTIIGIGLLAAGIISIQILVLRFLLSLLGLI